MCGRYTNTASRDELVDRFNAGMELDVPVERFNICPTEEIVVVTGEKDGGRRARTVRWGLVPRWAKSPEERRAPMINARAETLFSSRVYADLVEKPERRCLVLADGF